MKAEIKEKYRLWCKCATEDPDLQKELAAMDENQMEDAFAREMEFGTAGLRSIIGAGTNRMNVYTVARASQGLADYVCATFPQEKRKIAIGYDSRIKSDVFAKVAAEVFAANGISAVIYKELTPVPFVSFAVRRLSCAAGVMVTASHNPAAYNGYKVYAPDGGQITAEAAKTILENISRLNAFEDVKREDFSRALAEGKISYVPDSLTDEFLGTVKKLSVVGAEADRDVAIVYTPLNGAGLKPVTRILRESGYTNITVVKEQEQPDGNFPTCPYPNPEIREALTLGMEYAARCGAELLLATDPDCDRVGIAVRNEKGEMELLTGNEVGVLLLDFLCARKKASGSLPEGAICVKTIVTTDLAERVAEKYGVRTVNVLTGFKYIGEQIGLLEQAGHPERYILGFEESYGYLSGTHVRDKDGVNGAFLICEMFAYYKAQGKSLLTRMKEIYAEFGCCLNTLHSYTFAGADGMEKMQALVEKFRAPISELGGRKVLKKQDYLKGIDGLPKSNVLKFYLEGDCSAVVRPSGTEPKVKTYISVNAPDRASAEQEEKILSAALEAKM